MATLSELKEELEPFRNTLVIGDFDNVVRLVDVFDDKNDYYWIYDSKTRKGIYHSSCVLSWIPLKGFIKQEDYDRMVRIWNLNSVDKAV